MHGVNTWRLRSKEVLRLSGSSQRRQLGNSGAGSVMSGRIDTKDSLSLAVGNVVEILGSEIEGIFKLSGRGCFVLTTFFELPGIPEFPMFSRTPTFSAICEVLTLSGIPELPGVPDIPEFLLIPEFFEVSAFVLWLIGILNVPRILNPGIAFDVPWIKGIEVSEIPGISSVAGFPGIAISFPTKVSSSLSTSFRCLRQTCLCCNRASLEKNDKLQKSQFWTLAVFWWWMMKWRRNWESFEAVKLLQKEQVTVWLVWLDTVKPQHGQQQ